MNVHSFPIRSRGANSHLCSFSSLKENITIANEADWNPPHLLDSNPTLLVGKLDQASDWKAEREPAMRQDETGYMLRFLRSFCADWLIRQHFVRHFLSRSWRVCDMPKFSHRPLTMPDDWCRSLLASTNHTPVSSVYSNRQNWKSESVFWHTKL